MRRSLLAGVALLALLGSGCGARTAPESAVARVGGGAEGAGDPAAADAGASPVPLATEGGDGAPGAAAGDVGAAAAGPSPSRTPFMNNGELVLTPTRPCAEIGQIMEIRVQGPPNAALVLVVQFSDDEAHGTLQSGLTDATGRYDWRFPIPLDAPPGKATAVAVSSGRDFDDGMGGTEGGGGATASFMVAALGGC